MLEYFNDYIAVQAARELATQTKRVVYIYYEADRWVLSHEYHRGWSGKVYPGGRTLWQGDTISFS